VEGKKKRLLELEEIRAANDEKERVSLELLAKEEKRNRGFLGSLLN